jgi:hypothetical protein
MITDYLEIIVDYVGPITITDILIFVFGVLIVSAINLGGKK